MGWTSLLRPPWVPRAIWQADHLDEGGREAVHSFPREPSPYSGEGNLEKSVGTVSPEDRQTLSPAVCSWSPRDVAGTVSELELPQAVRSPFSRDGRTLHELSIFPVLAHALLPQPLSLSPLGACPRGLAPCPSATHKLPDSTGIKEALKGSLIYQPEHSSSPLHSRPAPGLPGPQASKSHLLPAFRPFLHLK